MIALKCHTSQTFTSQSARSSTVQVQDVILTSLQKGREFPLSNITRSVPIKAEPNLFKLGNFVFTEDRAQFVHGLKKREHHCHVFQPGSPIRWETEQNTRHSTREGIKHSVPTASCDERNNHKPTQSLEAGEENPHGHNIRAAIPNSSLITARLDQGVVG